MSVRGRRYSYSFLICCYGSVGPPSSVGSRQVILLFIPIHSYSAVMAQSVEHHLGKVEVPGSNPGNSSMVTPLLTAKRGVSFN